MDRDKYGAIKLGTVDPKTKGLVEQLVRRVASADKVDEHGSWEFQAEFDSKGRGAAINWDLYGVGYDVHTNGLLAVVQVRRFERRYKNGWGNVRKNYFLIGTNEDGTVFAHAVSSRVVHTAIRNDADVIEAVQNWIFQGSYRNMLRQGDIALVPMKARPAGTRGQLRRVAILEDSHRMDATQIAEVDGRIYAKNPRLQHLPGTHPSIAGDGWHRVIVGRRARFWSFAAPTID